jgi:hypothetical protein
MRKSTSVTVTLLAGLMLTSCCVSMGGCGRASPDRHWYDEAGNRVEEKWKTDAGGNKLLDDKGRPIPDPHVPYDRYRRPWVYDGTAWVPLPPPAGSRTYHRSGSSWWAGSGSGYRGFSSGGTSSPSHTSGSSISRGGFGSTGSGSVSS